MRPPHSHDPGFMNPPAPAACEAAGSSTDAACGALGSSRTGVPSPAAILLRFALQVRAVQDYVPSPPGVPAGATQHLVPRAALRHPALGFTGGGWGPALGLQSLFRSEQSVAPQKYSAVKFFKFNCNKSNKDLGKKLQIKVRSSPWRFPVPDVAAFSLCKACGARQVAPTFHLYRKSVQLAVMTGAALSPALPLGFFFSSISRSEYERERAGAQVQRWTSWRR